MIKSLFGKKHLLVGILTFALLITSCDTKSKKMDIELKNLQSEAENGDEMAFYRFVTHPKNLNPPEIDNSTLLDILYKGEIANDERAFTELGIVYRNGLHEVTPDEVKSLDYLHKAVLLKSQLAAQIVDYDTNSHISGDDCLGYNDWFEDKLGKCENEDRRALILYEGAVNGNLYVQKYLSSVFMKGSPNFPKNVYAANMWNEVANQNGYQRNPDYKFEDYHSLEKLPKNHSKHIKFLAKKCIESNYASCGVCNFPRVVFPMDYQQSNEITQAIELARNGNVKKAEKIYRSLAGVDPSALTEVGVLIQDSRLPEIDGKDAKHYYQKSAELGEFYAKRNLASILITDANTFEDLFIAACWITDAGDQELTSKRKISSHTNKIMKELMSVRIP